VLETPAPCAGLPWVGSAPVGRRQSIFPPFARQKAGVQRGVPIAAAKEGAACRRLRPMQTVLCSP